MPKNDYQKIWKRWNKKMREMKKMADADNRDFFLLACANLRESIDRFETKELQTESNGAKNLDLFDQLEDSIYKEAKKHIDSCPLPDIDLGCVGL